MIFIKSHLLHKSTIKIFNLFVYYVILLNLYFHLICSPNELIWLLKCNFVLYLIWIFCRFDFSCFISWSKMLPWQNRFCCCLSLRAGGLIMGSTSLFFSLLAAAALAVTYVDRVYIARVLAHYKVIFWLIFSLFNY